MQNLHKFIQAKSGARKSIFIGIVTFSLWSGDSNAATATRPPDSPAAPDNLAATVLSTSRINLTWTDNSTDETGFTIKRKVLATGAYTDLATVDAGVTSYSDIGLNSNTVYYYIVCAYNATGDSASSNEVSAMTFMEGPTRLSARAISNNRIDLTWVDNTVNEAGFKIERKNGANDVYVEIAQVGRDVTSYADTSLAANSQYFYRLYAYNPTNISGYSNQANATTGTTDSLKTPNKLKAISISKSQITLSWVDSSANENGFTIERRSGTDAYAAIAAVGANVTAYLDSGLSTNRLYFYRVRAFNTAGNSGYSNEAYATTWFKEPSDLAATAASHSQINLTWMDNSVNETSFRIERRTNADSIYAFIGTAGQNATSFSDSGLSANTTYFYRVRATNTTNVSVYSNEASATTFLSTAVNAANRSTSPDKFFLAQNYPNPFTAGTAFGTPATTIFYTLPHDGNVSLKIINLTGQEVAILAQGYQSRGAYRVRFEAKESLPTGVYYAILKAGELTQVRRMIYAK